MKRNVVETIMGAVVLAVAGSFFMFAYESSSLKTVEGYSVEAKFGNASGIGAGSEVRLGGVKIGAVQGLELDSETYQAVAMLQIKDGVKLPKDSSAAIVSAGLIGDKFVAIEPGADENYLAAGDRLRYTQSSISFEELLGKFVFSGGGVDGEEAAPEAAAEAGSDNPASLGLE